jgi:hypothetical protein
VLASTEAAAARAVRSAARGTASASDQRLPHSDERLGDGEWSEIGGD